MKQELYSGKIKSVLIFVLTLIIFQTSALADSSIKLLKGQTVYVPTYSYIYVGFKDRPLYLSTMLSIRNTGPGHSITILAADYYDSNGKLIKRYVDKPDKLNAMASMQYIVREDEKISGPGANFIVKWESEHKSNEPIIEAVMFSTRSGQGISFTSRGRAIKEQTAN